MNEQQADGQAIGRKHPNIKKILTILVITLVILLPTILAIVLIAYSEFHDDPTGFEGVEVVLYDKDRNELFRENGNNINTDTDSLVKILCAIDDNRQKYVSNKQDDQTTEPLIANIIRDGVVTELTCYFSFYSGDSWCYDSSGEKYLIPDIYSDYFIQSVFAEPLYSTSVPPTLLRFDGGKILPQSSDWHYRNESGQWLRSALVDTASSTQIYIFTGGISMSFSEAPSSCTAKLYEQNIEIYSGDIEGISSIALSKSTVRVSVTATWDKNDSPNYYGEQTYDFLVAIQNKAEFIVSSTNISENYPVLIRATNIENLSSLIFESEDTSFEPEFHLIGTTAFALIPYPTDVAQTNETSFSFKLTYGVSSQTFTLTNNDTTESANAEDCKLLGISPDLFESTIDNIFVGRKPAEIDKEKFKDGNSFGYELTSFYKIIASPFTEYLSVSGHGNPVKTYYAGKVAYVGSNSSLGNYVIIDLGLNIKLWYCFLGETYVQPGDIVAANEVIGTTSSISIRDDKADGFAYMFSYHDYILSPDFVFGLKFEG